MSRCESCSKDKGKCRRCRGTGEIDGIFDTRCDACGGDGQCSACNGKGYIGVFDSPQKKKRRWI